MSLFTQDLPTWSPTWESRRTTVNLPATATPAQIEAALRVARQPELGMTVPIPGTRRPWWWWLALGSGAAWVVTAAWILYRATSGHPVLGGIEWGG